MAAWVETTEAQYDEMLGAVPPAVWIHLGFLVGEASDHDQHGRPRYAAFARCCGKFYAAEEPMTAKDFRALTTLDVIGESHGKN